MAIPLTAERKGILLPDARLPQRVLHFDKGEVAKW